MVSIGGNIRPYVGDLIAYQNLSGANAGTLAAVTLSSNASGMFNGGSGNIGSLTSGTTLRSLSGIAVPLPLSGQTVWVVAYISSA